MVFFPFRVITGYHGGIITYSITGYQGGIITYSYYRVSTWYYYLLQLLQGIRVILLTTVIHGINVVLLRTTVITGNKGGIIT